MSREEHPLLQKELTVPKNWRQWRKEWDEETSTPKLEGMLFRGFEVYGNDDDWADRVCFYLDLADSHEDHQVFPGSNHPTGAAQRLAKKAFTAISLSFFKNTEKVGGYSWARCASNPRVLEKLLWFFRLNRYDNLLNADCSDNHSKTAREFALDFCKFAWRFKGLGPGYWARTDDPIAARFFLARPRLLRILAGLDQMGILLEDSFHVDFLSALALRELALNGSGNYKSEPVPSIADALWCGNETQMAAARIFHILQPLWEKAGQERKAARRLARRQQLEEQLARLK